MATADSVPAARVRAFLIQGALWNIGLFALIRLAWFDRHVIGALVDFQQAIVTWYAGAPHTGIVVTSSCSGADVMALCIGVTLAYPVAWTRRLIGAVGGATLILALNAIRIGTLYEAQTLSTLDRLHTVIWPIVLTIVTIGYVVLWIRGSERGRLIGGVTPRLVRALIVTLLAYAALVPWVFTSSLMWKVGEWAAASGGAVLAAFGAGVHVNGSVLATSRGAFQVTPECLFTPMVPIYLAAVWTAPMSWRKRWGWLAAIGPVFFGLGVVRLLVLALPPLVASRPTFVAHGFYQLVAGFLCIVGASHFALRKASGRAASTRAVLALLLALVLAMAMGGVWQGALLWAAGAAQRVVPATLATLTSPSDQQGALAMMPVYQFGLVAGLWLALTGGQRPRRLAAALVVLWASQIAFLMALGAVAARYSIHPHALVVRGWAVAAPLAIALVWAAGAGSRVGSVRYRRFWEHVGDTFPSLTGAASTTFYFENEKRLIAAALPALAGRKILKTDLWDEAKNTRIMQWVADQGADVYGIDLSGPIVREARAAFDGRRLRPAVSDVRRLPFADRSFDAIYSMGTIEHFAETEASVHELARVLRPGGRLILGVPNRRDPFLRPLMVAVLYRLGLYGYGLEKSYTRRQLRRMMEAAGLTVEQESGILFIPGWLRMLDLWCYTRVRPLARVTGALVKPFVWLDAKLPALRRHGYLLASVGTKPHPAPPGVEYVIDARGCDPVRLQSLPHLQRLFDDVTRDLALRIVDVPRWHVFPGHAGITGIVLLAESHLTIHTYPEAGLATINLYCCRREAEWAWPERLRESLGAEDVNVRTLRRG